MRRIFTTALSLLALGGAARAADLPPAPQLPPLEAQPLWTGLLRRAQCRRRLRLEPQRLQHRRIWASVLQHVACGRRRGRRGRLQLADGSLGPRARSELRGERAQRQPHGAVPPASLRGAGGELRAETALVRNAATADRLCARELAPLRHGRRRPRPSRHRTRPRRSAHSSPLTIAARREAAGRWAAESKSNSRAGWSAKIEYLYVDLGSRTTTFLLNPPISNASRFNANVITAGVNYHF